MFPIYFRDMGFLLFRKKNRCDIYQDLFDKHEQLIKHSKEVHHRPILKCLNCGTWFLH